MTEEREFRAMLRARQEKIKSLVCTGLDPLVEKMPPHLKTDAPYCAHLATDVAIWMMRTVDGTSPYTSMYKLQRASWEAIPGGVIAMQMVISYIKIYYSDIPVFVDCKRGDIGRTQQQYKIAVIDIDGADGMNFSPYMGKDCMEFLSDGGMSIQSLVGLCYTSNPASREMQDVLLTDGRKYWEFVAMTTLRWAEELHIAQNSGLVMAAAYEFPKKSGQVYSEHLSRCRELVGDKLWFLVPGVGTQGGYIKETVKAGFIGWGSMAINSSSDIIFASSGEDFAEAAGEKARQLYLATAEAMEIPNTELVPESRIVLGNPLQTLVNLEGHYQSKKNEDGTFKGPLVAYAGTYKTETGEKNYVGDTYFNLSVIESHPRILNYFAELMAEKIRIFEKEKGIKVNYLVGVPTGGVKIAQEVGRILNIPGICLEKEVLALKTVTEKEKFNLIFRRNAGVIKGGDYAIIFEDLCNNFSTTEKAALAVTKVGGKVVAVACVANRSISYTKSWGFLPVIAGISVPSDQYCQDDLEVADLIAQGLLSTDPKKDWGMLKQAME